MCRCTNLWVFSKDQMWSDCLSIPDKKEVIPRKILGKAAAMAIIQIPCPVTGGSTRRTPPLTGIQQCRGLAGHAHPVWPPCTSTTPKNVGKEDTDAAKGSPARTSPSPARWCKRRAWAPSSTCSDFGVCKDGTWDKRRLPPWGIYRSKPVNGRKLTQRTMFSI